MSTHLTRTEWDCPICGQRTSGTWSEGGNKWAICETCMETERALGDPDIPSWHSKLQRRIDEEFGDQ